MAVATEYRLPDSLKLFLDGKEKPFHGTSIILPSSLSELGRELESQLNDRWKPHGAYQTEPRLLYTTPADIDSKQVWVVHGSFETPVSYTAGNNDWIERVVNLVCQVGKALHFLILGEAAGLENDLARDVAIIAHQAGLDFSATFAVEDGISEIYNDKGAFVLLNTPNKQVLEEKMKEHLTAVPSLDVNIYYSGHAFEDGSWFLSDDCSYTGEDFCQFIKSCQNNESRLFYGDLKVYLDSCYGLNFAKAAVEMTDEKWNGYLSNLKSILKLKNLDEVIEIATYRASELESKSDMKKYVKMNKLFTSWVVKLLLEKDFRLFPSKPFTKDKLQMYFFPFSIGELDPSGVLMDLYTQLGTISDGLKNYLESLKSSNVSRGNSDVKLERANENFLDAANDPTIYCFPAGYGDSTLIRFRGVNILIDGGVSKCNPCFWPVVSRLPTNECLNVVILTHQDIDHLRGIERLILTLPDDAFVKQLYCLDPPPKKTPVHPSATYGGITVWDAAKKKKCAKALQIGEEISFDIDENFKMTLQLLAPTEAAAKLARSWMKRTLTAPNLASAVVYLAVLDKENQNTIVCNALFTGDAPSSAVLHGMETYNIPDAITYVDVPHHGSIKNKPELLFNDDFTCQVACISTNGKLYFHPDVGTLDHLVKQFKEKKITKQLLFTYCDHAISKDGEKRNESVKEYFKRKSKENKIKINVCMAQNKHDVSPPTHCLKVTLKLDPDALAVDAVVEDVLMNSTK